MPDKGGTEGREGRDKYLERNRQTMWLPGHLAIGFMVSFFAVLMYARRERSLALPLAYAAFFSVLPDFLHIGDIRAFSHSLFGVSVLLVVALPILAYVHGWRPLLALIAVLSIYSHLLADLFIGHIFPWYPWSSEIVQYNQFNTLFDIRVELGLCAVAFILLAYLVLRMRPYFEVKAKRRRDLLAIIGLLAAFFAFTLAQFFYYLTAQGGTLSSVLLSFVFLFALTASTVVLVPSLRGFAKWSIIP